MAARTKVLIDLNILLDVLQRREAFYPMSARVLASAETGHIEGMVAAHSLTTLFYIIRKYSNAEMARLHLAQLLLFLPIATVDQTVIEQALALPYDDFEDAVQMSAAVRAGAEYLITRDTVDFKAGPLTALQPAELLALIQDSTE
jgi:predicted nucleic acid-binding protein